MKLTSQMAFTHTREYPVIENEYRSQSVTPGRSNVQVELVEVA